jgi:hypothetical protein
MCIILVFLSNFTFLAFIHVIASRYISLLHGVCYMNMSKWVYYVTVGIWVVLSVGLFIIPSSIPQFRGRDSDYSLLHQVCLCNSANNNQEVTFNKYGSDRGAGWVKDTFLWAKLKTLDLCSKIIESHLIKWKLLRRVFRCYYAFSNSD